MFWLFMDTKNKTYSMPFRLGLNGTDLKVPSKVVAIPQVTAAPSKTGKAAGKQPIHGYVLVHIICN